jgi:cysteine desulfuration protein SufE
MSVPKRLQEIMSDFEISEGREKLELLLEYAESLPPLPEWLQERRQQMDSVPECMTPVAVFAEAQDGHLKFHFDVPPESPTVRGYASILAQGLDGATPEEVLGVPNDFYQQMGLHEVLSHQRLRGMAAVLAHIKQQAVKVMGS